MITETTNATTSNDDLLILHAKRDLARLLVSNAEPFALESDDVLHVHTDCLQVCELMSNLGLVRSEAACATTSFISERKGGNTATFKITICDADGMIVPVGRDALTIELEDELDHKLDIVMNETPTGFLVSYRLPETLLGCHKIAVRLYGSHIKHSPVLSAVLWRSPNETNIIFGPECQVQGCQGRPGIQY